MKTAAWLMPAFLEGSGGHRTMFQNMQTLIDHGYKCDVYVEDHGQVSDNRELEKLVEKYFGRYNCNYYLGYDKISPDYDVIFATAWFTAKIVRDIPGNAKKVYFIQDFEALFNPMGDGYLMALNSYCYGLHPVTIGHWLAHKMESEYSTPAQCFDFCADHSIYKPLRIKRERAICFVYQPDKPRRCSVIGIEALGIVKYLRPDVKIYLYGSKEKGNVWFEHENLGIISIEKCNELYNRCSVGLCISSSNPSRIPFEMMAAGLPVVDLHMENNLYDMPDDGVLLAHYTPESIAEAVINLLDNAETRMQMSKAGITYMKEKSLEKGFEQFYQAIDNIVCERPIEKHIFDKIYMKPPVIASVVMEHITQNTIETGMNGEVDSFVKKLKRIKVIRNSIILRKLYRMIKFK